jgi:hypothetical protein
MPTSFRRCTFNPETVLEEVWRNEMTSMTVRTSTWTRSARARIEALELNPVVQDVLAWSAFAGLSALAFVVFLLATWI